MEVGKTQRRYNIGNRHRITRFNFIKKYNIGSVRANELSNFLNYRGLTHATTIPYKNTHLESGGRLRPATPAEEETTFELREFCCVTCEEELSILIFLASRLI